VAVHQPHPDGAHWLRRAGVHGGSAVVEYFLLSHCAGSTDTRGAPEGIISAEVPGPVQAQVNVQEKSMAELEEKMLPVSLGSGESVSVQEPRTSGEPSLRAADTELFPQEDVPELPGEAVDRMPFGH
jgi:hypothetical protein